MKKTSKNSVSLKVTEDRLAEAAIGNSILALLFLGIISWTFVKHQASAEFIYLEAAITAVALFSLGASKKMLAGTILMFASMSAFAGFVVWASYQLLLTGNANIFGIIIMDCIPAYIFYLNLSAVLTHIRYKFTA